MSLDDLLPQTYQPSGGPDDVAIVVPSIRKDSFERFVKEWEEVGLFSYKKRDVTLILIEDNPEPTFESKYGLHYSWKNIEADLGDDSWIIPRRSDTVRSYGYLQAYRMGFGYIMTLDDDCYPEKGFEDIVEKHIEMLDDRHRWFNTLTSVKPRGIPFYETGKGRKLMVNHGLWTNVLDYDAPTQLAAPAQENHAYDNRIVPQHSYFPFCGMNAMWRRDASVLMYHLLMGQQAKRWMSNWNTPSTDIYREQIQMISTNGVNQPMLEKLPFDRFGDIWCGIFMKRICDILGWNVSSGIPYIHHDRASNVFTNLKKEANGLEVNETLWKNIDNCLSKCGLVPNGAGNLAPVLYRILGEEIEQDFPQFYPEYKRYFQDLGKAMQIWAGLFID